MQTSRQLFLCSAIALGLLVPSVAAASATGQAGVRPAVYYTGERGAAADVQAVRGRGAHFGFSLRFGHPGYYDRNRFHSPYYDRYHRFDRQRFDRYHRFESQRFGRSPHFDRYRDHWRYPGLRWHGQPYYRHDPYWGRYPARPWYYRHRL